MPRAPDMTAWLVTGIGSGRGRIRDGRVMAILADDETPRRLHAALGGQMTALACRTPSDRPARPCLPFILAISVSFPAPA
jgi:hypothetical protein